MRKYRFFFHYHRHGEKKMTVVFDNKKSKLVDDIECNVPCSTKWNTKEPKLVMQGYASTVFTYKDENKKRIAVIN